MFWNVLTLFDTAICMALLVLVVTLAAKMRHFVPRRSTASTLSPLARAALQEYQKTPSEIYLAALNSCEKKSNVPL